MQLKEYLRKHELSVQQFADKIAVNRSTLYRYMRSEAWPRTWILEVIAEITKNKVTPDDFMEIRKDKRCTK